MRKLFEIDTRDYCENWEKIVRPSCRSIIIEKGRVAMIHSLKYDYYKFPGGGMESGENRIETLIRETREEAGLVLKEESIREFGYVHRIQKRGGNKIFEQDNFYYLASAEKEKVSQNLDNYEDEEHFTLEYVDPETAIETNRFKNHGPKDVNMIEREARVLEILMEEGLV